MNGDKQRQNKGQTAPEKPVETNKIDPKIANPTNPVGKRVQSQEPDPADERGK